MTTQPIDFDKAWGYIGTGYELTTPEQWAAPGWDMARILDELRAWDGTPHELSGPDMMNVANAIAAGLEERGYPMTTQPKDIDELRAERDAAVERALQDALTAERLQQLREIQAEYDRRNLPDMKPWTAREVVATLIAVEHLRLFFGRAEAGEPSAPAAV